jgi:hypothetical protein
VARYAIDLLPQAIKPSTAQAYQSAYNDYTAFCKTVKRAPEDINEITLMTWIAATLQRGVTYGTVNAYLTAVKHMLRLKGIDVRIIDDMQLLKQLLQAAKSYPSLRTYWHSYALTYSTSKTTAECCGQHSH